MSYQKLVTMCCDGCGNMCDESAMTVTDARGLARENHKWVYMYGKDLCPECH